MTTEPLGIACPTFSLAQRLRELRWTVTARWRAACDRLKWLGHKPSNLEVFAERELRLAGWFDKDGFYGDMMGHAVLKMVREFSEEGHSGMSAGLAINLFKKVGSYEPLVPLTGADDEWQEVGEGTFQNIRCSHVFRDADGRAYDIDGRVFREPNGCTYTSHDSRVYVEFPYTPKREYVDVPGEDAPAV